MPLRAGATLGPYVIVSPLGAGGMGSVYRARDTRLGREVAVKVLAEDLAANQEALARFTREARSVAALNHPNILAIYDVGTEGHTTYVVTELLEGDTLRARLEQGPLPPRRALELAIQLADGLGAAHDRGIVHCDLKPENVFLTGDGRLKILDFGLARRDARLPAEQELTQGLTSPGIVMGTPGYISPERLTGQPATAQSDVFAFGVVLHEMLTGTNPFRRDSPTETITAILRDEVPPLEREVASLPPVVGRIVSRCLEKRPEDRLRSVADLAFYLGTLGVEGTSTGSGRVARADQSAPAAPASAAPFDRRVAAGALLVVALICAALWGYVRLRTDDTISAALDANLRQARAIVVREHQERLGRLTHVARVVASAPTLRDLFATDGPTIADALRSFGQSLPDAPLLLALGRDGTLLAVAPDLPDATPERVAEWHGVLSASETRTAVLRGRTGLFHAALAPAEVSQTLSGFIVAMSPIDEAFARRLRDATRDEIVLVSADGVAASTLRGDPPWRTIDAWRSQGPDNRRRETTVAGQRFAASGAALSTTPPLVAIVHASRGEAAAPFRALEQGLLWLGVVAFLVLAAGALLLDRLSRRRGAPPPQRL